MIKGARWFLMAFGALILVLASISVFIGRHSVGAQGGFFNVTSYDVQILKGVNGAGNFVTPAAGSVTFTTPLFGTATSIQNYGQSSHWVIVCVAAQGALPSPPTPFSSFSAQLEASGDGVTYAQISNQVSQTSGCFILEGAGYFKFVRLNVTAMNSGASSGVVNAWYSSTGNSIPGGGLILGFKSSQPVTYLPTLTFTNTNLKSTAQSISTTGISIFSVNAFNPNGSAVYVVINGTTPSTAAVFGVGANASRDITFPIGTAATNPTVGCATSAAGTGDPATGCVVVIEYKPFNTVSSAVSQGGSPQNSQLVVGN